MQENEDQKNSKYGLFSPSEYLRWFYWEIIIVDKGYGGQL